MSTLFLWLLRISFVNMNVFSVELFCDYFEDDTGSNWNVIGGSGSITWTYSGAACDTGDLPCLRTFGKITMRSYKGINATNYNSLLIRWDIDLEDYEKSDDYVYIRTSYDDFQTNDLIKEYHDQNSNVLSNQQFELPAEYDGKNDIKIEFEAKPSAGEFLTWDTVCVYGYTLSPTTAIPTYLPTTNAPTTIIPTTATPTTTIPTTTIPTTAIPTTAIPTTAIPTTAIPTTAVPTTTIPTTETPTTAVPTTTKPTTTEPTNAPTNVPTMSTTDNAKTLIPTVNTNDGRVGDTTTEVDTSNTFSNNNESKHQNSEFTETYLWVLIAVICILSVTICILALVAVIVKKKRELSTHIELEKVASVDADDMMNAVVNVDIDGDATTKITTEMVDSIENKPQLPITNGSAYDPNLIDPNGGSDGSDGSDEAMYNIKESNDGIDSMDTKGNAVNDMVTIDGNNITKRN